MYKVAKSTLALVNLDSVKIYLLKAKAKKSYINVKIVFDIDHLADYYNCYIELIKEIDDKTIFHLEPSGWFIYSCIVDNTNTTRGILKDLRRLQSGKEVNTNTTDECWLYRAIKALDLHWN